MYTGRNRQSNKERGTAMAIFTGAGVAIITPFKENGDVNYGKN